MRGLSVADAWEGIHEEAALLDRISSLAPDDDVTDVIEELYEDCSELAGFDIGVAGAVMALSAVGAVPISSCNGGLLNEASHPSDIPHILFSAKSDQIAIISEAAGSADVGLINNGEHLELFARSIPDLNLFARQLLAGR